ncbi:KpsF/GutQ family sugar-phosphate isomerase [Calycomorphotria hydatis]|uniref:Arabinose 5-phosphate isomerase KdsD n=1 Tax=Calycomorphotria hydatis TaxID=2528027 RepID=A0A517TED1_9PLAN|nr:KpsF/GutQ family sugar-phosphate isomerase [Calycomorphotria hydatis]QDT66731.1 Arabinose 5-phosphate isomerase KdsD [Calycomorphotria hydatis]
MDSFSQNNLNSTVSTIRKAITLESQAISSLVKHVDETYALAVDCIFNCRGRTIIVGLGKSGLIGRKIAATLCSTGTPAYFLHPVEAFHGDLGVVGPDDLLFAISESGETEEVNDIIPEMRRLGVKVIAATSEPDSTLARLADIAVIVPIDREKNLLGVAPTISSTAMLVLGHALAAALVDKRGFSIENFATFHRGGYLGRKMLLRVSDVMHRGSELPLVGINTLLRDAICEITQKRLGAVLIVKDSGALCGIFTDGDLRRLLESESYSLDVHISQVMSQNPRVITSERLAAEALKLMEDSSVLILPVVDNEFIPQGVVHLHDLIKAGIA